MPVCCQGGWAGRGRQGWAGPGPARASPRAAPGVLAAPLPRVPAASFGCLRAEVDSGFREALGHPEFPVVIRESCYTSRKTTWLPRHRKMKPFPATGQTACPPAPHSAPGPHHPAEGPDSPVGMTGVMRVEGLAQVPTALGCPPASPPRCFGGPGRRPALSPRSHGPHAPASRVSQNPGSPRATDAGGWGALEGALASRLSRLGWGPEPGLPQSPQCSRMWSSQNLGGRSWRGWQGLLGLWNMASEGLPN